MKNWLSMCTVYHNGLDYYSILKYVAQTSWATDMELQTGIVSINPMHFLSVLIKNSSTCLKPTATAARVATICRDEWHKLYVLHFVNQIHAELYYQGYCVKVS